MGYKDRRRFLDDRWTTYAFDKAGNVTSLILVDAKVAGVWDSSEAPEGLVKVFYFDEPGPVVSQKVDEAAGRVVKFMGGDTATVVRCPSMVPLTEKTYGPMIAPLSPKAPRPGGESVR